MSTSLRPSSHPRPRLTPALLLAGALGLAACSAVRSRVQSAYNDNLVGRIADTLVGTRWVGEGDGLPPIEYTGRHTVLVFFDPAEPGTAETFEELRRMHAALVPRGVVFFGVTDASEERLGFFTDDLEIPFPVLTEGASDRTNFHIRKLYEPEVLVVDPYGRIIADGTDEAWSVLLQKNQS